jgi:FkbM family methyltransferase
MLKQISLNNKILNVPIREKSSDVPVFKEIFWDKIYHKKIKIEASDIWLDLGSNCGYFSLVANCFGAVVYSIEADPRNFEQTNKVLELNSFNLKSMQLAVVGESYEKEHITFYATNKLSGAWKGSLFKRRDATLIKVPAKKFNDLVKETGANCVKMDIEGAEFSILETSDFSGIKKMCFEWSWDKDRSIPRFKKMIKRIEGYFSKIEFGNQLPKNQDVWSLPNGLNYILVYCWK